MPARCKDRERILASGVVDVPALPLGAVRGILCFRCFEPTNKMLKCGGCRRVGYCSKKCQKLDWTTVHKNQCKLLQQVNEIDTGEQYKDSRTWDEYRRLQVNTCRDAMHIDELTGFLVSLPSYTSIPNGSEGHDIHHPGPSLLLHMSTQCPSARESWRCTARVQ
jgi:splicing suppressor protein 51